MIYRCFFFWRQDMVKNISNETDIYIRGHGGFLTDLDENGNSRLNLNNRKNREYFNSLDEANKPIGNLKREASKPKIIPKDLVKDGLEVEIYFYNPEGHVMEGSLADFIAFGDQCRNWNPKERLITQVLNTEFPDPYQYTDHPPLSYTRNLAHAKFTKNGWKGEEAFFCFDPAFVLNYDVSSNDQQQIATHTYANGFQQNLFCIREVTQGKKDIFVQIDKKNCQSLFDIIKFNMNRYEKALGSILRIHWSQCRAHNINNFIDDEYPYIRRQAFGLRQPSSEFTTSITPDANKLIFRSFGNK